MRPSGQKVHRKRGSFKSPLSLGNLIPSKKIFKVILLLLIIVLPMYYLLEKSTLINKDNLGIKRFTLLEKKKVNLLLVGTVIHEHNEKLSILSIFSIDSKKGECSLLSIPVDTQIFNKDEEVEKQKLSQIYQKGGLKLVTKALEDLLDDRLSYYIKASRKETQKIVDLLNGIEILASERISFKDRYTNFMVDIPSGWQRLDGEKASQYAYFSNEGESRNNIIERQQKLIETLTGKLFSQNSPLVASEDMVQTLKDNVSTSLTLKDIKHLIKQLRNFDHKELKLITLIGKPDKSGQYFIPDLEKNKKILSKILEVEHILPFQENIAIKKAEKSKEKEVKEKLKKSLDLYKGISDKIRVRILNGGGKKKVARILQKRIEINNKVDVIEVGNADNFNYKNTIIYEHLGKNPNALYIKDKFLRQGIIKQDLDKNGSADITIIIGHNFKP